MKKMPRNPAGKWCTHQYGKTWKCERCGYEPPKVLVEKINSVGLPIDYTGEY